MGGNNDTEAIFRRRYIENIASNLARAGEWCYSLRQRFEQPASMS
jgi:hypothetical protein